MHHYRRFPRLALGLLVGGVVLLAASIAIRKLIPDEYIGAQRAYLSALERQLAEFDSLTTGQRIALIGSSPIIMGLSAEQIETATGVPTRNLAMNASRAVFQDYAAMVVEHLRPGDMVIIGNPNLRRLPQMRLPLRCVKQFGFGCIRKQNGFRPHIVQDALVLFTDRAFGYEVVPRTSRGDYVFRDEPQSKIVPVKFNGPIPKNNADDIAKLALDVGRRGACALFVLTPFVPDPVAMDQWQSEFRTLVREIDEVNLHDILVDDSPLWNDPTLFHHDEHMSKHGREVWSRSVIAKLQENGLPSSCRPTDVRPN